MIFHSMLCRFCKPCMLIPSVSSGQRETIIIVLCADSNHMSFPTLTVRVSLKPNLCGQRGVDYGCKMISQVSSFLFRGYYYKLLHCMYSDLYTVKNVIHAQWVTLYNIQACFIREMWFVDCSCIRHNAVNIIKKKLADTLHPFTLKHNYASISLKSIVADKSRGREKLECYCFQKSIPLLPSPKKLLLNAEL